MPRTDAALLAAWQGGDLGAGEALFARHFDAVLRFFRFKAADACDELVQRTFTACLEKRDALRDAASFRAFLFGIARFELLRHYQRAAGKREIDLGAVSLVDLDPSPSRIAARNEEQRLLADALRRIPVDLQVVIELHYWEELSTAEIADVLGIPPGTVKSRLRRAREALEQRLRANALSAARVQSTLAHLEADLRASEARIEGDAE